MVFIKVTNEVFIVFFSPEEILLDANTFSIFASLRGIVLL